MYVELLIDASFCHLCPVAEAAGSMDFIVTYVYYYYY